MPKRDAIASAIASPTGPPPTLRIGPPTLSAPRALQGLDADAQVVGLEHAYAHRPAR